MTIKQALDEALGEVQKNLTEIERLRSLLADVYKMVMMDPEDLSEEQQAWSADVIKKLREEVRK
jgi:Mg2+ and Co2+ transporter CorA